ncbi:response regulator [Paraflavisolibacter sp. H34]|uniref:response regulator n=1 Tax=Huijunlia imazamoxiresistens TaxID=3127457 RepID=UPI00301A7C5A
MASLGCLEEGVNLAAEVESCHSSLIVIEYKLTKEDGIECVRQLKAHPEYRAIPVIMWSTPDILLHVKAAFQAGVQYYFQKPWSITELAEKLNSLIGWTI